VRKAKYTIIWKSSLVHSEESKIYNNMKILLGSQWGKHFAFLTVNQGGFSYYCIFCFPHCEPRRIFILLYILLSWLWTKEDFHIIVYFAFLTVKNPPWFTVRKAKYTIIWKSSLVHSQESKIYNNMKILLGSQWGKLFILLYILLSWLWTKEDFHIIVYFAFLTVNQGGFSYYCIFCFPYCEPRKIYNNMKILLGSQWGKQNIQ
jgi:hypothetical protein